MTSKRNASVVAVFRERGHADAAVNELLESGFQEDQVGLVGPGEKGKGKKMLRGKANQETYAEEGAVTGALAGAGVGGLIGLGVIAGVIPIIGPAVAAGTLGTILLNAVGGAAVATIAGGLIGLGIPEDEADWYENELKAGRYLVIVQAGRSNARARAILERHGGYEHTGSEKVVTTQTTTSRDNSRNKAKAQKEKRTTGDRTLELRSEKLRARKTPVETGEVRVRKNVVTEQRTLNVPVTREEVVIERKPVSRRRASSDAFGKEEIRVPVRSEKVRLEKTPVVTEEIHVGKRQVQDTRRVTGTVRKERVRVEPVGNVKVRTRTTDKAR